jgi:hypothetical protein
MLYYRKRLCLGMLAVVLVCAPVTVSAQVAASASYTLEASVVDGAGGMNGSYSYDVLPAIAQPGTVGIGGALSYAAGYGFIAGTARLLEGDEGEGEGEYEGEVPAEGEGELPEEGEVVAEGEISSEGETPMEGEVVAEGEIPFEGETSAEGEGEEEGEEDGCGCGCCRQDQKYRDVKELIEKSLGDWLLVGLCLMVLAPFQFSRR